MTQTSFEGTRVLVTGGAGFIGSHLVDALVERGSQVRVLDDFSTGKHSNLSHLGDRIELVEGDIRSSTDCRNACDSIDLVFHQAALGSVPRSVEDPVATYGVNVMGTVQLLTAAKDQGVRRVIYASSSSVYGDSTKSPKREGEEGRPLSPYAASKSAVEKTATAFERAYGLETVGLRYFNVYGPRQDPNGPYAAVVPRFLAAIRPGEQPLIYGDGRQTRDFTFVEDAVHANLLAAAASTTAAGETCNVATGTSTSVLDLADAVGRILGRDLEPIHKAARAGDVRNSLADLDRSRRVLGYEPTFDLFSGLARTMEDSPE